MAKTASLAAVASLVLASAVLPVIGNIDEPSNPIDTSSPVSIDGAENQTDFLCTWFPYLRPLCYKMF